MDKNQEDLNKKRLKDPNDTEEGDASGGQTDQGGSAGGQKGEIAFRLDSISLPPRDDMMSPEEIRRMMLVHKDVHKDRVDKQKIARKERAAAKAGKKHHTADTRKALGQGFDNSKFKAHPISNKAQFSGMDKQTSYLPSEFDAETNNELQDKLQNRLQNKNVPKFNPRPRGPN